MTSPYRRLWLLLKGELPVTLLFCVFLALWTLLLPSRANLPAEEFYRDDASSYHLLAMNLAESGTYSLDGRTPAVEREPGYSVFLAVVYAMFGNANRIAVFGAHLLVFAVSALFFLSAFRRVASPAASILLTVFLFFSPAGFHLLFFGYREILAFSIFLLILATCLAWMRRPSLFLAMLSGVLFGLFALTYMPLFLLPFALLALLFVYYRLPALQVGAATLVFVAMLGGWSVRNYRATDGECLLGGCERSELAWAVRAEQLNSFGFADPVKCLAAEYVTRDFSSVPPSCSFSATIRTIDSEGGFARFRSLAFSHPFLYAWTSAVWAVEFQFPYVNGWGRTYNLLELAWTAMILVGVALLFVARTWKREYWIFLVPILFATAFFSLIDVEPRYRMPIYGCYAALAAFGYTAFIDLIFSRRK